MMGRRKRDGNNSPPKNNLTQESQGNKEMGTKLETPTKLR
jgi:hypothetical protein